MTRFVIYEVWTSHRIVEAATEELALQEMPDAPSGALSLCNWHAVEVPEAVRAPASCSSPLVPQEPR